MRRRNSHDPLNLFLPDIERYINIGAWQYHPDTDHFSWSENLYQIFEIDKNKVNGRLDSYLGLLHSNDATTFQKAIKKCIDDKTCFTLNSRIQSKDGHLKTLRIWGGAITDKDGAVTAISGTCIDISGQQKLETQLWESEELNKKLLENTDNIIILQDKSQNVVYLNKNAIYASGHIIDNLKSARDFDHFFSDEDLSKMKSIFIKVIKTKKPATPKIISFIQPMKKSGPENLKCSLSIIVEKHWYLPLLKILLKPSRFMKPSKQVKINLNYL